jgi:hypothetical protein
VTVKTLHFYSKPTHEIALALLKLSDIPHSSGTLTIKMPLQSLKPAVTELSLAQIWTCESFKGPADYTIL